MEWTDDGTLAAEPIERCDCGWSGTGPFENHKCLDRVDPVTLWQQTAKKLVARYAVWLLAGAAMAAGIALLYSHRHDWQDAVNAGLEVVAVIVTTASIRKLYLDKSVKGIHPSHVAYSIVSATWFMYYYVHLDQLVSLTFAVAYFIAVVTWAGMMIAYAGRDLLGLGKGEL